MQAPVLYCIRVSHQVKLQRVSCIQIFQHAQVAVLLMLADFHYFYQQKNNEHFVKIDTELALVEGHMLKCVLQS